MGSDDTDHQSDWCATFGPLYYGYGLIKAEEATWDLSSQVPHSLRSATKCGHVLPKPHCCVEIVCS